LRLWFHLLISRDIRPELLSAAREYPVVAVFEPRQSGRTTPVQQAFPEKPYRGLEELDLRVAAPMDPRGFLATQPEGGVLDEVQRTPERLSYSQGIVDRRQLPGQLILTGSHQPEVHQAINQSLAGRTASC
jgi:hypothetical protein